MNDINYKDLFKKARELLRRSVNEMDSDDWDIKDDDKCHLLHDIEDFLDNSFELTGE